MFDFCFVMQYVVSFIALQSSCCKKELVALLLLNSLPDVL